VRARAPAAPAAMPLLAVAVESALLVVVGRLPPAWCATPAALVVVSHVLCSLLV
jgi:hypothetical protein